MDETYVWKLMAKGLAKDATSDELKELQELFRENPDLQQAYFYLQKLKINSGNPLQLTETEEKQMEAAGLSRIEKLLSFDLKKETAGNKDIPWYRRHKKWLAAASVIFVVGIAAFFFIFHTKKPSGNNMAGEKISAETFVAAKATSIELEDGTQVWLNRGSTLKCHKRFNKNNREVFLEGEGFFDVIHDAAHPFIVHLKNNISVKVLGTRFNVKAYSNTPIIEASLLSGKIAVDLNRPGKEQVIVKPNEKITINVNKLDTIQALPSHKKDVIHVVKMTPNPIDHKISETAWMDNRLSFYDMSFEELSYELERIYGREIIFKNQRLKTYHLTGSFKDETLEQVLKALQITTPFQYKITNEKVVLFNKP